MCGRGSRCCRMNIAAIALPHPPPIFMPVITAAMWNVLKKTSPVSAPGVRKRCGHKRSVPLVLPEAVTSLETACPDGSPTATEFTNSLLCVYYRDPYFSNSVEQGENHEKESCDSAYKILPLALDSHCRLHRKSRATGREL